jgi:Ca2+-binding RTX toxin-like protein
MAVIKSFRDIPDDVSPFETRITSHSSSGFTVQGPGSIAEWTGTGITYDAEPKPKTGYITGLSWKIGGVEALQITGMHGSIQAIQLADDPSEVLFSGSDVFVGHNGVDRIGLEGGNDTYYGLGGNDYLDDSGNSDDVLYGGKGNDTLLGGAGRDRLEGEQDNDTLKGEGGNDTLVGGVGTDKLYGGTGADRFIFKGLGDSLKGTARDTIFDFSHAQADKIDLSAIDANGTAGGEGVFSFVGSDTFGGTRAELRYADGILSGDVNGDRIADFEIKVVSASALVKGDFVL